MIIVGCYPGLSSNLTKYDSNRDNSYLGSYSLNSPLLGGNDTLSRIIHRYRFHELSVVAM
jgi:hypothetical protein